MVISVQFPRTFVNNGSYSLVAAVRLSVGNRQRTATGNLHTHLRPVEHRPVCPVRLLKVHARNPHDKCLCSSPDVNFFHRLNECQMFANVETVVLRHLVLGHLVLQHLVHNV